MEKKVTNSTRKHVPLRTCIACREVKPKRELLRIVCTADGTVEVDTSGKKEGRGAYLCRNARCWEAGLKGNRIEHHLKTSLSSDAREELTRYAREVVARGT